MSAPSRSHDTKYDANVKNAKQAHAQAHHRRLLEVTEMLREVDLQEPSMIDVPSQPSQGHAVTDSVVAENSSPTPVSLICHHNAASQKFEVVLHNIPLDRAAFYMNSTYQKEYNGGDKLVPD